MNRIIEYLKTITAWVFSHKKIVFVYIPAGVVSLMLIYSFVIYLEWCSDRAGAMDKLARYKLLIDRTEEMKKGYPYSRNEVEVGARAVDIPTRIYDKNGEIIGEFFEEKREIVPFDYIPVSVIDGLISSEDRDFYNHRGISYMGIFRAFVNNIIHFRVVQGGSTITQQLAKVLFTDMERSFKRKIYEAYCAREIEKHYDKQDILLMYLNLIYFGNGSYGVEATSKMFFGTSVRELGVVECAMIIATISNPGVYSPISNLGNSVNKTRRILESLKETGRLKNTDIGRLMKDFSMKWSIQYQDGRAVSSKIGGFIYSSYRINRAPFFVEKIRRELAGRFGEEALKKGGLSVYTTIDASKQDIAVRCLRAGVKAQRDYHEKASKGYRKETAAQKEYEKSLNIEGALISLNPFTGEIITYVGGYEFSASNQNDCVYQIRRQPGSSIKPLVYASAIEKRVITPSTVFIDEPVKFDKGYSPQNYSRAYMGPVIVREALVKSLNTIAVIVLDKTGYDRVFSYISDSLMLDSGEMNSRFMPTLSFALGAYEISPVEAAVIHSLLVNGGEFIIPYGIKQVKDYSGNLIWDNEKEVTERIAEIRRKKGKIMDPVAARVTISMLEGIKEKNSSTHWLVKKYGLDFDCAGKTGTTSNYTDAWFMGYTSSLVTAVWIGNKTGSVSLGGGRSASGIAAPVWAEYTAGIYSGNPPEPFFSDIDGMTSETICLETGEVAGRSEECPFTAVQYYYSGTEPGRFCSRHVKQGSGAEHE